MSESARENRAASTARRRASQRASSRTDRKLVAVFLISVITLYAVIGYGIYYGAARLI